MGIIVIVNQLIHVYWVSIKIYELYYLYQLKRPMSDEIHNQSPTNEI